MAPQTLSKYSVEKVKKSVYFNKRSNEFGKKVLWSLLQRPSIDMNERFLHRPNTTTA